MGYLIMSFSPENVSMAMSTGALDSMVCPGTLDKLAEDLGDEYTSRFVMQFCAMLPTRLSRLEEAMRGINSVAGQDAALSLKSGAFMAGATALAELAEALFRAFRDGLFDHLSELINRAREIGLRSIQILSNRFNE
ncbi:hypothetical protein CQ018_15580 [Arthrobacter sp. MYb227]|nr:hypothetical protein CQ018_15580 [Arthrobacter sp. MYb227]